MTRRKSRPLLPHELISNLNSSPENIEGALSSSFSTYGSSQQPLSSSQSTVTNTQAARDTVDEKCTAGISEPPIIHGTNVSRPNDESTSGTNNAPETTVHSLKDFLKMPRLPSIQDAPGTGQVRRAGGDLVRSFSQTIPTKRRPGYFANRRSASFVILDEDKGDTRSSALSLDFEGFQGKSLSKSGPESTRSLERTPSLVRLSMSLDGKAQVTTSTGDTPSPPRSQPALPTNLVPRPNTGLQRSFSAIEPSKKNAYDCPSIPRPAITGRSRDARTWEFYCDSDARNALTEQAEREESGSAVAAIGLIRSRSNNSKAMTPNPNKRNANAQKVDAAKRLKHDGQKPHKPKLERATSSVARLQSSNSNSHKQAAKTGGKLLKPNSQSGVYEKYDGDSDKENWVPGTQATNPRRRRPATNQATARILLESLRVPSHSASLDALMSRDNMTPRKSTSLTSSSDEKENCAADNNDEVAAFMGETDVPREVEDLDCVQNLLSLSQAAWQ